MHVEKLKKCWCQNIAKSQWAWRDLAACRRARVHCRRPARGGRGLGSAPRPPPTSPRRLFTFLPAVNSLSLRVVPTLLMLHFIKIIINIICHFSFNYFLLFLGIFFWFVGLLLLWWVNRGSIFIYCIIVLPVH